jgi:hypothetical protein
LNNGKSLDNGHRCQFIHEFLPLIKLNDKLFKPRRLNQ